MNKPYYILIIKHGQSLDLRDVSYLNFNENRFSREYSTRYKAEIILKSGERISFDCDSDMRGMIILEYKKFLENEAI